MVTIRYCETCGRRISEEDIAQGRAVSNDRGAWCAEHAPRRPLQDAGAGKKIKKSIRKKDRQELKPERKKRKGPGPPIPGTPANAARQLKSIAVASSAALLLVVLLLVLYMRPAENGGTAGDSAPAGRTGAEKAPGDIQPAVDIAPVSKTGERTNIHNPSPIRTLRVPQKKKDDSDGDGIPDMRETLYLGLNPHDITDVLEDFDGDGFINIQEYISHSRLDNPESRPDTGMKRIKLEKPVEEKITLSGKNLRLFGIIDSLRPDWQTTGIEYVSLQTSESTKQVRRFFLKFNLVELDNVAGVKKAVLKLCVFQRDDEAIHIVTGAADSDIDDFHPKYWFSMKNVGIIPETRSEYVASAHFQDGDWEEIDVTGIVRYWLEAGHSNTGFLFKMKDETTSNYIKWYTPSRELSKSPRLEIVYTRDFELRPNKPPVITSPENGRMLEVGAGESLTLQAAANDPDGDSGKLKYTWEINTADGIKFDDATGQRLEMTGFAAPGEHLVLLKVTDADGGDSISGVVVKVR